MISSLVLFVYDFDLLVDHPFGEPVDRNTCHAVALAKAGAPSNVVPPSATKWFADQWHSAFSDETGLAL